MRPLRVLLLLLLFLGTSLQALEVPPPPTQWLTDRAGLLSGSDAEALNSKLAAFEQRSGAQFIIYIFPSLEREAVEDFTIRCAEAWKVGNKKYDNGLILFVFVQEKVLRIETGYGLEGTITDAISSRVMRETIAPYFQRSDWAGGLNAGADELIRRIERGEAAVEPVERSGRPAEAEPGGVDFIFVLVIIFIFLFFILPMLRRGGGGCGGCWFPFFFPGGGGGGITFGGGGFGGGFGGGGGGFSGGGGSFGGGGATGGW